MYQQSISDASWGVNPVLDFLDHYALTEDDGLTLIPDDQFPWQDVEIPDRLFEFLRDIRLLRRVPLAYLVPDAALLPPESIRFFHVDPTWVDRVVDGVMSAASIGTADLVFTADKLRGIRAELDDALGDLVSSKGSVVDGITGMLIRSELAKRWPDMIVQAFSSLDESAPIGVLRCEPISADIHITLFAGEPRRVHIREPFTGVRYGVEQTGTDAYGPIYKVDRRDATGAQVAGKVDINFAGQDPAEAKKWRVIDIANLKGQVGGSSSMVALHLEQRPYVQVFTDDRLEETGSQPLPESLTIPLSSGRVGNLASLASRAAQANGAAR